MKSRPRTPVPWLNFRRVMAQAIRYFVEGEEPEGLRPTALSRGFPWGKCVTALPERAIGVRITAPATVRARIGIIAAGLLLITTAGGCASTGPCLLPAAPLATRCASVDSPRNTQQTASPVQDDRPLVPPEPADDSPSLVVPTQFTVPADPAPLHAPRAANYLALGPVFSVNPDPHSPRGLAEQIDRLVQQNLKLTGEIDELKRRFGDVERELEETQQRALLAERALQRTQAALATANRRFEDHQRVVENAFRHLQASEQQHLSGMDDLVARLRTTLSTYEEPIHETNATKPE